MRRDTFFLIVCSIFFVCSSASLFALTKLNDLKADGPPEGLPDMSHVPNAIPRMEKVYPISLRPYEIRGKTYEPLKSANNYVEQGVASWYGTLFHGRKTANGDIYDMFAMTAAHKILPLPTYVSVTNLENDRSIVVRVNDRGPFHANRVIDLSYSAASKLGMLTKGTALVEVRAIDPRQPQLTKKANGVSENARIYLQLASFGDETMANRMKGQMRRYLNQPVSVSSVKTQQGFVHQVQVGPLGSLELADKIAEKLSLINVYRLKMIIE